MEKLQKRLEKETTDLKMTLLTIDRDITLPMDKISENIKRISDILKEISDNKIDTEHFF